MQLPVPKTLNVEAVERELAELWKQTAGAARVGEEETEEAVLRARVANLMIFIRSQAELAEIRETLAELSAVHPCRALVIVGEREAPDIDIELHVSAFCKTGKPAGTESLCCEEITLIARGKYVSELASAALPLLVSDLPVFLWWRDELPTNDRLFVKLASGAERLVLDSAEFSDPLAAVSFLTQLCEQDMCVSDINWARLTSWRSLLASFYDVALYRPTLDGISHVRVDYVAPHSNPDAIAPQACLIAGWLASRLDWHLESGVTTREKTKSVSLNFLKDNRRITLALNRVAHPAIKAGRLAEVELRSERDHSGFSVSRSGDGLHLTTQVNLQGKHPARVLPVRNRGMAQLLSREMEILARDIIYEEAIKSAAAIIAQLRP